jgi:pilus assembly protein CpaB
VAGTFAVVIGLGLLAAIFSRAASPLPAATPIPPRTIPVVVTTHDLAVRTLLQLEDLTLLDVPVELAPLNAVSDLESAVGRITMIPLVAGEMIARHHLANPSNEARDLAFIIGEDQILMAFPTTDLMSQINILQPGDFVDILASLEQPVLPGPASATEEEPEKELFTFSALQQVEVSAIVVEIVPARATGGTTSSASRASATDEEAQPEPTPTPEPAEINPQAILMALSPQDALVLKHIKDAGGIIDIVLRAPTAKARFELNPVMAEYLRDRFELVISR